MNKEKAPSSSECRVGKAIPGHLMGRRKRDANRVPNRRKENARCLVECVLPRPTSFRSKRIVSMPFLIELMRNKGRL